MTKFVWRLLLLSLFITTEVVSAKIEAVLGPVPLPRNQNLSAFAPTTDESEIIISREQYVISYNRVRRAPNWVAWKLEADDIGKVGRAKVFNKDPDLENYFSRYGGGTTVDSSEYQGSCFDRGHQVPSKDRTDTVQDNKETFLTSNIVPQTAYLNRTIWEHLESYTRDLVLQQSKTVYVIAGPIYDEDFGNIGPNHDIPVPSKNFKIILALDGRSRVQKIVTIMPNVLKDGTKPIGSHACPRDADFMDSEINAPNDWQKYQTTIQEVERVSGLRFPKAK